MPIAAPWPALLAFLASKRDGNDAVSDGADACALDSASFGAMPHLEELSLTARRR